MPKRPANLALFCLVHLMLISIYFCATKNGRTTRGATTGYFPQLGAGRVRQNAELLQPQGKAPPNRPPIGASTPTTGLLSNAWGLLAIYLGLSEPPPMRGKEIMGLRKGLGRIRWPSWYLIRIRKYATWAITPSWSVPGCTPSKFHIKAGDGFFALVFTLSRVFPSLANSRVQNSQFRG